MTERWPRLVGGDPALDFVNTDLFFDGDRSADVLSAVDEFLAWCAPAGVATTYRVPAKRIAAQQQAFLQEAVAIRSAMRSVMQAIAARRQPDHSDLNALRSAYADAVEGAAPTLDRGRLSWEWDAASPRGPLDELVGAAIDLLRHAPLDRLKACPNCGHLFLDTTKNGSRRWCSMEDCGTQVKMQRYVTKRAESRGREVG
jgi:predicted RNA-binding Zn ribbon-like protein